MGTHYSFYLRVGFEISEKDLLKPFRRSSSTHTEGVFHMEDRFNIKTGNRLEPVKVWDTKPKTTTKKWLEINGERLEDWDPDGLTASFKEMIGCNVDYFWKSCEQDGETYVFYPHSTEHGEDDYGNISISNRSMDYQTVVGLEPQLKEIKNKLEALGIIVADAKVFIGEVSG